MVRCKLPPVSGELNGVGRKANRGPKVSSAGQVSRWLSRRRRMGRWQGRAIGTIYIALGVRFAIEER